MKEVAETYHLQKRGQTWHFYRRVPTSLVSVVGKTFIKQSLGTADLKTAKILRSTLDVKWDAEFASAGQMINVSATTTKSLSLNALTKYLHQHIQALDESSANRLSTDPPESEEQKREMIADAEIGLQILKNRDDPRAGAWIEHTGDKILRSSETNLSDKEIVTSFAEIVRRGLIELQNRKLDRLSDQYHLAYHDPLFDRSRPTNVTFGELSNIFWEEQLTEYKNNDISQKRCDGLRAELDFLHKAIGENRPIGQINDDVVQALRKTLARTPSNRMKLYPKLTLEQAIDRAARDGKPVLSPTTQTKYLNCLSSVLAMGLRKGLLSNNPAANVKPIKKDKTNASDKRMPWTEAQLIGFFHGQFYNSCVQSSPALYTKKDRGWRFWLPLLMLFSGARPNEICQLHTDDIKTTAAGTWFLNLISSDDDEKTLKNPTSRRRVPLHPELIKIGFLGFVEARRKKHGAKELRLFPEIKPDQYGNMASYPTRRFRESFIPAEITLGKRQSFYSLRHNVRDALRRAKAPSDTLRAVTGWAPSSKTVSDAYGDPGNPDLHIEYVEKIAYPGLDLGFLHDVGTLV